VFRLSLSQRGESGKDIIRICRTVTIDGSHRGKQEAMLLFFLII